METYLTKSGESRFKEKVRLQSGKLLTKTFRRKTDALAWKRKTETEKTQGMLGYKITSSILFKEVAEEWFEANVRHNLAYKTNITYRYTLNAQVIPTLGTTKIALVTLQEIENLKLQFQRKGLKAKTINRVMTMVRQILLFSVDRGYISEIPLKGKTLLMKAEKKSFNFFEDSEVKALLRENKNYPIFPILYLGLHTGMRLGEITGICWDRVNFTTGRIEITRTLHRGGILQDKPKSKKPRYFPMNDTLRSFFMDLRRTQSSPSFVFTNQNGEPYNPDHFSGRNFKVACKRANVRKLRFHDLRHTFASHFMMKDGNLFDLKELLGHADIKDTMIYAHVSPEHLKEASQIVDFGISFGQEKAAGPSLALAESGS